MIFCILKIRKTAQHEVLIHANSRVYWLVSNIGLSVITDLPHQCKMIIVGTMLEEQLYGNALYFLFNVSLNLNLLLKNKISLKRLKVSR